MIWVSHPTGTIRGNVSLPASKSISNRLLIMQALSGEPFEINNLSEADDTRELQEALKLQSSDVYAGNGGTTYRFLTSYLATQPGSWKLTSGEMMQKRSIKILVDALRSLGISIQYLGEEGFPPLQIEGMKMDGGAINLPSNISSQFASALLMIGPTLRKGLEIQLRGSAVSRTYIDMTIGLMKSLGIEVSETTDSISVKPGTYQAIDQKVEADWSAASYFFGIAGLSSNVKIELPGLKSVSLQPDCVISKLSESMGVSSRFSSDSIELTKSVQSYFPAEIDATNFPDLVPTLSVWFAANGQEITFSGVHHLKHKESNRMEALKTELTKVGIALNQLPDGRWHQQGSLSSSIEATVFSTHDDHRMAMAFSMLSLKIEKVGIKDPGVVSKSFPGYWEQLKNLGFEIK